MYITLAPAFWPETANSFWRKAILAIGGTLLLTVSAKIQIPFWPVPLTMQTFMVLTIGIAYGWRLSGITMLLYLAEGAMGLPVFAGTPEKGIGLAYMMSGTGGYLAGFVFAAMLCGFLAERGWDRKASTTVLGMLLGNIVIYGFGLYWLGTLYGWDKPILSWGLTPFILGDFAKIALAALALPLVWKVLPKHSSKK